MRLFLLFFAFLCAVDWSQAETKWDSTRSVLQWDAHGLRALVRAPMGVEIWNPRTLKRGAILSGVDHWEHSFKLHFNGQIVAVGNGDSTIEIWEGKRRVRVLGQNQKFEEGGHEIQDYWEVNGMAFSPDGKTLASLNRKGCFLWDWKRGRLVRSWKLEGEEGSGALAWSPDGKFLAIGPSCRAVIQVFETATTRLRASFTLEEHMDIGSAILSWSRDGKNLLCASDWIYSASSWSELHCWDWRWGRLKWRWMGPDRVSNYGWENSGFSPDSRKVALLSENWLEVRRADNGRLWKVLRISRSNQTLREQWQIHRLWPLPSLARPLTRIE